MERTPGSCDAGEGNFVEVRFDKQWFSLIIMITINCE